MEEMTVQSREPPKGVTFEQVWAMFQETAQRQKETARQMEETDRLIEKLTKKTDKQLDDLGNRFGELAEHLLTPNITEKFRALGYAFTKACPNVEFFDEQRKVLTEVDVWLENEGFALAVEVKAYLRDKDVDDHVKRMEILRRYAEERRDQRKLLGAATGSIVRDSERGFYVIEPSGDTVKIDVPEGFSPRIW